MSKNSDTPVPAAAEFNLKHRLTGAAVLIFFGVLVLPWMLGPPGESDSRADANAEQTESIQSGIEAEVAKIASFDENEEPETVYVSKITPLDATRLENSELSEEGETDSSEAETRSDNVEAKTAPVDDTAAIEPEKDSDPQQAQVKETSAETPVAETKQVQPPANTAQIDVGWVVQVGLFTDKGRAEKFIQQLADKGFGAQSSVVDTNKGKGTGTRVWLGPFARQVAASRERDRLKSVAGQDGFVRRYPFTSR